MGVKHFYRTVQDLVEAGEEPPLPLSVMPNNMGINLVSVEAVSWIKQDDGQLVSLTIHFLPADRGDPAVQNITRDRWNVMDSQGEGEDAQRR